MPASRIRVLWSGSAISHSDGVFGRDRPIGRGGKIKEMREMSKGGGEIIPGMANMPTLGGRGSTKTASVKSKFKQSKKKR